MQHFNTMSLEDLNLRYGGTLVRYERRPFWIENFTAPDKVKGIFLDTGKGEVISSDSIDSSSPRLGFVNGQSYPTFMVRRPARYYKQGLNHRNTNGIYYRRIDGHLQKFETDILRDSRDINLMKNIANVFNNNYPSVSECLEIISSRDSVSAAPYAAFSREFCLVKLEGDSNDNVEPVILIDPTGNEIGELTEQGDIELHDTFVYLRELLEERQEV